MTVHIGAKPGDIAETVLMPGDPYRARWAAETFLSDARLVNETRGMLGFTGTYKGNLVTIQGSGMGMPSLSIYANELMMRFLQRSDPHPVLFDRYRDLLGFLAAGESPQGPLRLFEKQLLESAGFGLQLAFEHGSERPIDPDGWYQYVPESGPVRREPGKHDDALVSGEALLALQSGALDAGHQRELKRMMRRLIAHYLGDRPLKSQSLYYES